MKFIMEPICKLALAVARDEKEIYMNILEKQKIMINQEEKILSGKELGKIIMSRWLPAADCLLETIILHLPSPIIAQKYRTSYLYEGPKDDSIYKAM